MEGGVVAICAAAEPARTITVGTGEAGIDYHLLQPAAVLLLEISGERTIPHIFLSAKINNPYFCEDKHIISS
jgi:hypothetical protein